jgi:hypothetical protein
MQASVLEEIDVIEEIRLRTWARENYVPAGERDEQWHAVVLEEMSEKDRELQNADAPRSVAAILGA